MPQAIIDLTGQRFGKWLILKRGPNSSTRRSRWVCRCDCGTTRLVQSGHLRRGLSTQCRGCARFQGYEQISLAYWNHLINGAKERGIGFKLTIEEAWQQFLRQQSRCALTGQVIFFARCYGVDLQTASLDRIDSSSGYIVDNIQWTHKDINMLKGSISVERFIQLCQLVTNYQNNKLSEPVTEERHTAT